MKKPKLYLETSVWNFYYADDAPEKRDITIEFFNHSINKYDVFISIVVIDEINKANEDKKTQLVSLINKFNPATHYVNEEVKLLANMYISSQSIPQGKYEDALHAAITTVNDLDILVSWNFRHLASIMRERKINVVNLSTGYKSIKITTPMEVLNYED